MKVVVSADHRGYRLKESIKGLLASGRHEVSDVGCDNPTSCDYPDHGLPAAEAVSKGEADRAVMFCGTGIGMSIAANKVRGVRAAVCHDEVTAEMSRRHNNANVLCLPADLLRDEVASKIVEVWLKTEYEGGRHDRRLQKIAEYEARCEQPK